MENEKQNKLGAGIIRIITISAIELVFSVLLILGLILFLIPSFLELAGLSLDQMGISHITIFIRLVATLLNILGIILILRKKAIGLYIYLLLTAANIIYSIIMNGFMISTLIGTLILPILMTFFVYRKKELFGLSK